MKKRCEHCGGFTEDLETVALQFVMALQAVSHLLMLEDETHTEGDTANISRLFEYLAIPLDNALHSKGVADLKGGADE